MSQTARAAVRIHRPIREVERFATSPSRCLPVMSGFGRFKRIGKLDVPKHEEWEVFLTVGTLQIGGAVDVDLTRRRHLMWTSLRGTTHTFDMAVEPIEDDTLLTLQMKVKLHGQLMASISERLARGIMQRHLEAGAQELRHHLEWELG